MKEKETKPIDYPKLPIPYSGVLKQVYRDYITDPNQFLSDTFRRLKLENPILLEYFKEIASIDAADTNASLKWMSVYYQIFSRTAEKRKTEIVKISSQTLYDELILVPAFFSAIDINSPTAVEEINKFLLNKDKAARRRRKSEKEISAELSAFWNLVEQEENFMEKYGATFDPLNSLQRMLHGQDELNHLKHLYL